MCLYKASDLILRDHLCGKLLSIKWVDLSMPHNRKCTLRDHLNLVDKHEMNPDSTKIFKNNLIYSFYYKKPTEMEDICLYEFVAWYAKSGMDTNGNIAF